MSSLSKLEAEISDLKKHLTSLRESMEEENSALAHLAQSRSVPRSSSKFRENRVLSGHYGKIYAFSWGPNNQSIVSASQDGSIYIWHAFFGLKLQSISLRSSWVMSAAYSLDGKSCASGGLDNMCTIYAVKEGGTSGSDSSFMAELSGHEGYLSSCAYLEDNRMLTTSGDGSAAVWDIEKKMILNQYRDHSADVMCASIDPTSGGSIFVTGSVDSTAKLWDIRSGVRALQTFPGHESDINTVSFYPSGSGFVTGSDDSTAMLFDIKAARAINVYKEDSIVSGITSLDITKGGKFMISAYDDGTLLVWDAVYAEVVQQMEGHGKRVSCVKVSNDGLAIGTASWDTTLMIWS